MTAKKPYEMWQKSIEMTRNELDIGIVSLFLKLPAPMSYEVWVHLHKIKGDYE